MTEPKAPEAFDEAAASMRVTPAVLAVPGVTGLAPGLRDLVATAAARVMRREGGEPPSVDVRTTREGVHVRVDAYLDASRSVSGIVDDLFEVIAEDLQGGVFDPVGDIDIDLRIVGRGF
ncbi:hypothetical protein [Brevibacterium atlanticum]|uniref:hypothetical protein n=1 Tax=Brevibacterium atlanticum TaxID=2697563 RepID=UPI0014249A92|nr:hypothetical protein [Brevibacterium atlanticum]